MPQFPSTFLSLWKAPNTKKAFVSEAVSKKKSDCQNCGGSGIMSTFVGVSGPFNTPPVGKDIVAHYGDGKWWGGQNFTAPCPVCGGMKK